MKTENTTYCFFKGKIGKIHEKGMKLATTGRWVGMGQEVQGRE